MSGAFILGSYDITGEVLIPSVATTGSADIVVLYLWLLGGLMGVWSRTGAAQAFAEFMTVKIRSRTAHREAGRVVSRRHLLPGRDSEHGPGGDDGQTHRRPRSASATKSWPTSWTRRRRRSPRNSRSTPGPAMSKFIFVGGVSFLATEVRPHQVLLPERAVLLLRDLRRRRDVSAEHREATVPGQATRGRHGTVPNHWQARRRRRGPAGGTRTAGQQRPRGYKAHVLEFFAPLIVLIGIAVGTFVLYGAPEVHWAFGGALRSRPAWRSARGCRSRTSFRASRTASRA